MFKVVQYLDQTARLLDPPIIRTVCAADHASHSFLAINEVGRFIWIPIWACRYQKEIQE